MERKKLHEYSLVEITTHCEGMHLRATDTSTRIEWYVCSKVAIHKEHIPVAMTKQSAAEGRAGGYWPMAYIKEGKLILKEDIEAMEEKLYLAYNPLPDKPLEIKDRLSLINE